MNEKWMDKKARFSLAHCSCLSLSLSTSQFDLRCYLVSKSSGTMCNGNSTASKPLDSKYFSIDLVIRSFFKEVAHIRISFTAVSHVSYDEDSLLIKGESREYIGV